MSERSAGFSVLRKLIDGGVKVEALDDLFSSLSRCRDSDELLILALVLLTLGAAHPNLDSKHGATFVCRTDGC